MSEKPKAVLIHTFRGGKDPHNYWTVVTSTLVDLHNLMNKEDIWRPLSDLDENDSNVICWYADTRKEAREAAKNAGYSLKNIVLNAIGY